MPTQYSQGEVVYAGYPTAYVYDFKRNTSSKKLVLSRVKHLLFGDWIKVTDYDYATVHEDDIEDDSERNFVHSETEYMVPVRVRNRSGYMKPEDLLPERLLEVVFVDVGQGDGALMVTPNDRKYVVDAGVSDNMYRYLKWRFSSFEKAKTDFDGLIVTHPDKDHYYGFNRLVEHEKVQAKNVWHNGLVEQFSVSSSGAQSDSATKRLGKTRISGGQKYLTGLVETDAALLELLNNKDRWIKKSSNRPKQYPELLEKAATAVTPAGKRQFPNISMLSTVHGEMHDGRAYLPGFGPGNNTQCVIEIIGPVVERDSDGNHRLRCFTDKPMEKTMAMDLGKTKNGHSIIFKVKYKDVNLFFGGDLNSAAEMHLLGHYSGLDVFDVETTEQEIVNAARPIFECDVTKACHHGSADFTDAFLACLNPAATVISSGDAESHAHPRSDTLGAIGHHGRGQRSLIFSTELSRSTDEFSRREDSPWYQAQMLKAEAGLEQDPEHKAELLERAEELFDEDKKTNVTVYGSINLRTDGKRVVLAYMLEKPSASRRWDVYTLESRNDGKLYYRNVKDAAADEKQRRENSQ